MTDFRSVIKFGDSSYVISMPKHWLERNAVKKGDVVQIEEGPNNELIVRTKDEPKREVKELTINVDEMHTEGLKTLFVSAYLNNHDVINIVGKKVVDVSNDIRKVVYNLASVEITEQTPRKIVARTFLDPTTVSIEGLIRRIDTMVRSMLEDGKESINGKDMYEYVYQKEHDVTRLTFLAHRILNRACREPEIAAKLNLKNWEILRYVKVIEQLEKIADQAKRIPKHMQGKKLKYKENLLQTMEHLTENYNRIMKAYYTMDKQLALTILLEKLTVLQGCKELVKGNINNTDYAVIEKFRNIGAFSFQLAQVVIDS